MDASSPVASGYSAPSSLSDYLGVCTCQNTSWGEIKIRRPAGNTGWMMHLQNRPHPLSLTHPAANSIPQSNISLLSTSLPTEKLSAAGDADKEYFYSREVGSFTDIGFLSNLSADLSTAENKEDLSKKEGENDATGGVSISEPIEAKTGNSDVINTGHLAETTKEEVITEREQVEVTEEKEGEYIPPEEAEEPDMEDSGSAGEAIDGEISLNDLSATEFDALKITESSKRSDDGECAYDASSPLPSHLGRPANSKSWSESSEASPLGTLSVAPRASSLSYAMDFLPPLFSYDEGDEFGISPSFFEGEKPISDEEQV